MRERTHAGMSLYGSTGSLKSKNLPACEWPIKGRDRGHSTTFSQLRSSIKQYDKRVPRWFHEHFNSPNP
jgi:hypothetical protein